MVRMSGTSPVFLVGLVYSVCLVCLNQRDQIDRTDQIDQMNGMSGRAACWWTAAPAPAIGRPSVETGEADGDGGPFARRAADGNRTAMFFDDLLDRGET